MQRDRLTIGKDLDVSAIILFYVIVFIGWFSIHAAIYDPAENTSMFDLLGNRAGKQFIWIICSMIIATVILLLDYRFWISTPIIFYGITLILLIVVLLFARNTNGASSWLEIGPFKLQPSEFAKVTTSLLLAKYMDENRVKIGMNNQTFITLLIIIIPTVLILLQNETGTVLVFTCFVIVLYREGLTPIIPLLGIAVGVVFVSNFIIGTTSTAITLVILSSVIIFFVEKTGKNIALVIGTLAICILVLFSVDFIVEDIMQPHQRNRIYALFDPESYASNEAYQTMNAIKAMGHGGLTGTGHLKGDLTQLGLVPEQFTDFIFCTIGEEHGWLGILVVISLYMALLLRIIFISERQKAVFPRIYGYSVASIMFFHFMINVGMEIGFLPVIGIPLPMLSYGGSSLWAFTILLFILLKFDMHRGDILGRT